MYLSSYVWGFTILVRIDSMALFFSGVEVIQKAASLTPELKKNSTSLSQMSSPSMIME